MKPNVSNILKEKGDIKFSVSPDVSVLKAIPLMTENHGAVVVMDGGKLVGIFTERDSLTKVAGGGLSAEKTLVKDVMTRKVIYGGPDLSTGQAVDMLMDNNIRHLPILENDKVLGMVCVCDLVKYILKEQKRIIGHLTEYIELSY